MPPTPLVQCNPYKGANPRCWVRLRFAAADGSLHERELLADTGCPCAIILGQGDLSVLMRSGASPINSNFGPLAGAWLELHMPELGITRQLVGYGSDLVLQAVQSDCPYSTTHGASTDFTADRRIIKIKNAGTSTGRTTIVSSSTPVLTPFPGRILDFPSSQAKYCSHSTAADNRPV